MTLVINIGAQWRYPATYDSLGQRIGNPSSHCLGTGSLTGMANWDYARDVSAMDDPDREVVRLYLVCFCIIEQLANVFSSQNTGLEDPLAPGAYPTMHHHARERYQGHP